MAWDDSEEAQQHTLALMNFVEILKPSAEVPHSPVWALQAVTLTLDYAS